jgi:hypothetical protein
MFRVKDRFQRLNALSTHEHAFSCHPAHAVCAVRVAGLVMAALQQSLGVTIPRCGIRHSFLLKSNPAIICLSSSDVPRQGSLTHEHAFSCHPAHAVCAVRVAGLVMAALQQSLGGRGVNPERTAAPAAADRRAAQYALLVILIHFGFQRCQLLADFIIRFQFGKLLIQRLLFAKTMAAKPALVSRR